MAEYNPATDIIAHLIFGLFPRKERYRLAMDRTNWKFGETNINVLTFRIYKQRWQLETAFRAMKLSGFNIEDIHLSCLYRLEKLFSHVMVAFAWAYVVRIYVNDNIKLNRIKNDGKRIKSLFKYGLETIANYHNNPLAICNFNIFEFLSCT
jgi:hypothetical protein